MTRRIAALAAVTVALATVFLPGAAASAQVCGPPTAEHAFEELLDLAPDDSPLEDRAWRIADEQEAKGAFETSDTIRRVDDLARASGYAFNCVDRMYHPVSGPDPRDAIVNGEDAPEEDLEAQPGDDARPAPGADGSAGRGEPADNAGAGGAPSAGDAGPAGRDTASGGPTDSTAGVGGAAPGDGGEPQPGGAVDGERAADQSAGGTPSDGPGRNTGIAIFAALAGVLGGVAAVRRRRPQPPG